MDTFNLYGFYFPNIGDAHIDDTQISTETTWSSSKINDEITNIIDDDVTTDDKTWSSDKIYDELTHLDCGTF